MNLKFVDGSCRSFGDFDRTLVDGDCGTYFDFEFVNQKFSSFALLLQLRQSMYT